jgi:hypothetical protein
MRRGFFFTSLSARRGTYSAALLLVWLLTTCVRQAPAAVINDPVVFSAAVAALGGSTTTLDFEAFPSGTLIPNGGVAGGITFTSSIGFDMIVSTGFSTTSGVNYLGVADGSVEEAFIAGDEWEMAFAAPLQALGLYFITSDELLADDIRVVTSAGTAQNAAMENAVLADGGRAYFIGLVSATSFTSAQVRYGPGVTGANFIYNVDDITTSTAAAAGIPEPSSALLVAAGLVLGWRLRSRAARK